MVEVEQSKNHYARRRKTRSLSNIILEKMKSAPETLREKVIIGLFINTGLRISDISTILVTNIDLDSGMIIIPSQEKTEEFAYVPLPEDLVSDLKIYIRENKLYKYLFPGRDKDRHISMRQMRNIVHKIRIRAGVTNVTPHDFRATLITNAGKENIPPGMISKSIGLSLRTVTQYYEKYTVEDMKKQFKKIQK